MDSSSKNKILKRYIFISFVTLMVALTFYWVKDYLAPPPGDFETRQGDIHLSGKKWTEAIKSFEAAIEKEPTHRGAMIGKAIALMQNGNTKEAEDYFKQTISFLENNLADDDPTGKGALAAAYANLGILYDKSGAPQKALDNYIESLKVDSDAVSGPGFVDRVVHGPSPSTIRDRAIYLANELQKPEKERLLYIPKIDQDQRMYKP